MLVAGGDPKDKIQKFKDEHILVLMFIEHEIPPGLNQNIISSNRACFGCEK